MPTKTICSIDGFEVSEDCYKEGMHTHNNIEIDIKSLEDLPYVAVERTKYFCIKRILDIVLSVIMIVLLAMPLAFVALAVYLDDPGPVFFRQYRVGRYGKRFRIYKFRSMKVDAPKYMPTENLKLLDCQITRVGKWIRKLSIDELPQLLNVLLGDMSLVGPRPLISDEYEIHKMRMRFGVYNLRPGITGLAQISGRDLVEPADKVKLDVLYLQEFGFWSDIKILLSTLPKVLGGKDIV